VKRRRQDKRVAGDWRARLVPAAAVTPAPRVSVVDAAVKDRQRWIVRLCSKRKQQLNKRYRKASRMHARAMECQDRMWTSRGEGDWQGQIWGSRTKAGGAKAIRDRCSSGSKLCRHWVRVSGGRSESEVCGLWG